MEFLDITLLGACGAFTGGFLGAAFGALIAFVFCGFALMIIGSLAGMIVAIVGQIFSRFWLIRGDTHIDPPASSIFPITTLIMIISLLIK